MQGAAGTRAPHPGSRDDPRLGAWITDLGVYLRTLFRAYRHVPFSVGAVATGLAFYNQFRRAAYPELLPAWAWTIIAVLSLTLSAFSVWRSSYRAPVDEDHAVQLKEVAGSLLAAAAGRERVYAHEGISGAVPQEMFEAHFPDVDGLLTARAKCATEEATTYAALEVAIAERAREDWAGARRWVTARIAQRCFEHVTRSAGPPPLDIVAGHLTWSALPISERVAVGQSDKHRMNDWVQEIRGCDAFAAWEAAKRATSDAQEVVTIALNRIRAGQGIRPVDGCERCRPRRPRRHADT